MSNFLNNFSNDNYKTKEEEGKNKPNSKAREEQEIEDDENLVHANDNLDQPKAETNDDENQSENSVKKSRFGLSLQGKAFEAEKVDTDEDYHKYKLKNTIVICATSLIIFFVVLASFFHLKQDVAITHVDTSIDTATAWLDKHKVKYDVIYEESDDVDKDVVIKQSIPAGEQIGPLEQQALTVSSGPNLTTTIDISEITKLSGDDIDNYIDEHALINANVSKEYSDSVKEGSIIRTEFEDDSYNLKNYKREQPVKFVVSKGAKDSKENIKVENFEAQTVDTAITWATENGVILNQEEVASDIPAGYIVSQDIEAGSVISFGDVLTLEVSKGPGIATPSFIGLSQSDAESLAKENEILCELVPKYSDVTSAGNVMYQSIAIGDGYYPEDTLEIDISLGQPFIQDYSGMYVNEAISAIEDLNASGANLNYQIIDVNGASESSGNVSDGSEVISSSGSKGTIQKMSPYGEYVSTGSTITFYVYN